MWLAALFEGARWGAFRDVKTADEFLAAVKKKVKKDGWLDANGGTLYWVATTVRAWILKGFMMHKLLGQGDEGNSMFRETIKFLDLGRKTWANVPREQRGSVFEPTYSRGIRRLYLELLGVVSRPSPAPKR